MMEPIFIAEEAVTIPNYPGSFLLTINGEFDSLTGEGNIYVKVLPSTEIILEYSETNLVVGFNVRNDLMISMSISTVTSLFAICLATTLGKIVGKELYKHWQDSVRDNPDFSISERISDVADRVQNSGAVLGHDAKLAIEACLVTLLD